MHHPPLRDYLQRRDLLPSIRGASYWVCGGSFGPCPWAAP